jgi:hypothetical protein
MMLRSKRVLYVFPYVIACFLLVGCKPSLRLTDTSAEGGKTFSYPFEEGSAVHDSDRWLIFATFYDEGSRFTIDDEVRVSILFSLPIENPTQDNRALLVQHIFGPRTDGIATIGNVEMATTSKATVRIRCTLEDGFLRYEDGDKTEKFSISGELQEIEVPIMPTFSPRELSILNDSTLGDVFNYVSQVCWVGTLDPYIQLWADWKESHRTQ